MDLELFKKVKSFNDRQLLKPLLLSDEVTKETIAEIISRTDSLEENHSNLITLASIIKGQNDNYQGGYKCFLIPTDWQKTFSKYMMYWHYIPFTRYLFSEWPDIAQEGLKLLSILISENALENFENDDRFKTFYQRYESRLSEVRQRKGNDFLNDNGW